MLIPTLIILVLMVVSLLLGRGKLTDMGIKKIEKPMKMMMTIFLLTVLWTLFIIGVFMPVLNHLTGSTQDLSTFENLKGNIGKLVFLLAASWTLAAFGEEIAYPGFLQTRISELFADKTTGILIAVALSSLLFGYAHTEQGIIGVVITTFDSVFFSLLRYKYKGCIWAPVLAHGFSNTIGIVTFFFTGPIYGLW